MRIKIISLLLLGILVFFCLSCGRSSNEPARLPPSATNRIELGNGWVTFELAGRMFLFYRYYSGYEGYGAITELSK